MADSATSTLAITLAIMLVASAFFSTAETAMMASNRYRLKHRAQRGNRGARLALGLLAQTDRLLGVIRPQRPGEALRDDSRLGVHQDCHVRLPLSPL